MATEIGKLKDEFARLDADNKDATAARDKEQAESIKVYTDLILFTEKSDNKVAKLATAIGKLEDDIARLDAELKDATADRDKEHAEYIKASTNVSATEGRIAKLETQCTKDSEQMRKTQTETDNNFQALTESMPQLVAGMMNELVKGGIGKGKRPHFKE